jgi:hypothetical protein
MKVGGGEWEGGYEGAEAFGRRTFGILGKGSILRAGTVFSVWDIFLVWSLGGLLQGCTRLLGVLGSGARNPHRILELGSRIGSVPSWQGGKIRFWAEFGQSSNEDRRRLEKQHQTEVCIFMISGGYH